MRISDWSSDVCSSDLAAPAFAGATVLQTVAFLLCVRAYILSIHDPRPRPSFDRRPRPARLSRSARKRGGARQRRRRAARAARSEEHTSELQSLMRISYAVFCLKKQMINVFDEQQHEQVNHTRT